MTLQYINNGVLVPATNIALCSFVCSLAMTSYTCYNMVLQFSQMYIFPILDFGVQIQKSKERKENLEWLLGNPIDKDF